MSFKEIWEKKAIKSLPPKGSGVTEFGKLAETYFPQGGFVLEIGAGAGMDSIYFAKQGHHVQATDISDTCIGRIREDWPKELEERVIISNLDVSAPLPYADESFDAVYASVSLHYFDNETTDKIFKEIYRILKPNGILAMMLNPKRDDEIAKGKQLEEDYYEIPPEGIRKRYFTMESAEARVSGLFETLFLDDKGNRLRSTGDLEGNRVRYIGRRREGARS